MVRTFHCQAREERGGGGGGEGGALSWGEEEEARGKDFPTVIV